MKKRTLVCFLIFTLCVFYTAIPNTVFGQEEGASLAEQVHEKYSETLQREDIQAVLPQVLEGLKAPNIQALLTPAAISAVVTTPSLLTTFVPTIDPQFVTLLEEDAELRAMLSDPLVQSLLTDVDAIDELAVVLAAGAEPPDDGTTTPAEETTPPVPEEASLAEQVLAKHALTLQRADIQAVLPDVLEGLKAPNIQALLTPAAISAVVATPSLLTTFVPTIDPQFVTLLEEDAELRAMLSDPLVQSLLTDVDAIEELAVVLAAGPTEPEVTEPEVTEPEVTEPEVTVPEVTEPEVTEPEVTEPEVTEPEVTEPEVTEPEVTEPEVTVPEVTPPTVTVPFESVPLTNLSGKSRLGGLSLNNASGRKFVEDFIAALAPAGITLEAEVVVDAILEAVPKGYLPIKQIRQILLSQRLTAFPKEADHLDPENFGNAITPNFADFLYTDFGEAPNQKYLTSDGLHVYTRVPSKDAAGVEFSLSNGTTVPGTEVTMEEFGADTIDYTFRLEETLAATNLPAWPGLSAQLFSSVKLRWSNTGAMGDYFSVDMQPVSGENGVVWQTELGIPPSSNTSIFYYFEVVLAEPLTFTALDRDAIAALDPTTVTLADIFDPANLHKIRIDGWAMPDPRNLQLVDRGILGRLFTPDLATEFSSILASPQVIDIALKAFAGQQVNINEILNIATPKQLRRIRNILLRNTEALTTQFENEFDPMLASVFTLPHVDLETHSLWTARIDNIADGNYQLKADVLDADGTVLDRIQENITVDTSAPEGGINIGLGENVTGYQNGDVFIATVPTAGTAGMLNISGTAVDVGTPADLDGVGGYLFYQMIGLNEDGTPYLGEPSTYRPNTWMPLTVDSTMLVSNIWEAVQEAVAEGRIEVPSDVLSNPILQAALVLPLSGVLDILNADLLQRFAGPFLKGLEPYIGFSSLSDSQYQLIINALGKTVDIIDHLVPVTFNPSDYVVMPIQGENMPLLVGDYGIRAMGIDTLFNVGSYAAPTHLRIVAPVSDKASVTAATIADQYRVGEDEYEIGTIYANTTEGVKLTGTIERTPHPVTVLVQYEDASGTWTDIGAATVNEMDGTFEISWNVSDFDALLAAGATVNVQAIATNKLQLTDPDPMPFSIKLDAGDYPPEVLALTVDEMSIMKRNPDSEGPQGTVIIDAYTLDLTGPPTVAVRFEAKRESDAEWKPIGTANQSATPTDLVDAVQAAIGLAAGGTDASVDPADYLEWSLTVDTKTLDDTITKDNLDNLDALRDYTEDNNPYTIRAFAVSMDTMEWPSDAMTMLSVDNVDDVGPLGPTNITRIVNTGGMVEADTHRGLVDKNDPSVVPQSIKLTIEPTAVRKTYTSVMLVSDPEINAALISEINEPVEDSGVFVVTVDIGALGIEGNGTYKLHALVDDEPNNGQDGESPESTVRVKNYERPDPAVFKITKDLGIEKNADSEGPQGTFMFTGYTIEQNSPPIMSIRLEAKRASDTQWTTIGAENASTSVAIEDAALPGVLDHLTGVAVEGTAAGNRSVVAIDATYHEWVVSVNTKVLGLPDSITNTSPGARDVSLDDNPYTVRAFAVDSSGKEWSSDAIEMFSLDNVDDVAPLGPTNVSVTGVMATDNSVFEDAGAGSYTVGGLVDKYDDAVNSPVATFTVEPTAVRKTYASVRFVPGVEGLVITDVTETAEGSGVFTLTVDVGTLADMETYLANGTYMFHALAFDEFGNEQADDSETDGSKISVTVSNTRRPAPQVLAFTVGDPTQTNPDSGAPQGSLAIYGYSPEITSAPTTSVMFEVKRKNDTEWTQVGTASGSPVPVTAADDAKLAAASVADVADVVGGNVVKSDTYQKWMIQVDTTTLEDSITADSPGARDYTQDDNQYMVRATAIAEADGSANLSVDGVTAMFSVDNVDDVAPLGPTNVSVTSVDAIDSVLEAAEDGSSYTVSGLVDKYDEAVPSPVATFTLKPTADRKTYDSVRFVPGVEGLVITDVTETAEGSGVFTVTVDVGTLADMETYLANGTYMFHALAFDEFGNVQEDTSETDGSKISVTVSNTRRPAPEVLAFTVGDPTQTNPDSGAPQGTLAIYGYSPEITSAPTTSVMFEVKRKNDTEWTQVGTASGSPVTAADDAKLAAASVADVADVVGGNVVKSDTYQKWMIQVDTTTLEDSITADSPGARDYTQDDNQYMVRATAIAEADGSANLSVDGVTAMFSVDNVDDVAPLGPTNVSVTSVDAIDSVLEAAEDGSSYTVGGLVDKYDEAVPSPVATFTLKPTADRKTYDSVRFVPGVEGLVITDVTETAEGSGVFEVTFEVTVDVGTLADGETYLAKGTYMFHALAFDELGNVQADMSETDGSKISVTVSNTRRPAPQVLAFTVGDPTQTNPDSGAPQGSLAIYGYSPEITSAPTTSVMFEVKRKNDPDTEWKMVGTASDGSPVTAADDAKLAAANVADVADVVGGNVVKSDTYQKWMIQVDTTTLEDSITADSPGERDHTKDDNQYMVRATAMAEVDGSANLSVDGVTAMFSVDNVDDVAPLGPTNVSVTSVDAIDSVLEAAEDGSSYTVGGLVDKYDEAVPSPVATFTLKPTADQKTYKSVRFVPGVEGLVITDVTETAEGSGVFTLTVDVGTLADMETYLENGTYMFHALAFDEFGNEQADDSETDGAKISVIVENSYRPAPEVLALAVDPESITQTNPDSGAPQGTITLHAYSHEISSPPTTAVRFEVKRPNDAEWIDVGTSTESSATGISDATLTDVVGDLAHVAVSATGAAEGAEGTVVPISRNQMWMIEVDTTTLEDTITADSPAARDHTMDDNQYMVRAVAIAEADGSETVSTDDVTAMFSVDNVDDVAPLGPTNIIAVSDILADGTEANIEANEDGSYSVGGIVDVTVQHPVAIFTIKPTAERITYDSVKLVTDAEGAVIEEAVEIEDGVFKITVDVADVPNGSYMFHALAFDKFGNVQEDMSETDGSRRAVGVTNFRVADITDLAVIAVDGADVAEPPAEPIPLRESLTVSFVVANGSLDLENLDHKLTATINGQSVESEPAEDPKMTFTLTVMKLSDWEDNFYTPDGVVTQRNGFVPFPLAMINLDNTGPMVTIESPTEDETVDSLPTLRATYHDGPGAGVDGATGSLALARLQPPNEVEVVVDQAELEKDAESLVYTRREPLAGGAYRVTVQVTDNLGNVGEGSAEFAVNGTAPMVAIHSPAAGQTFEHGEPLISGEFSGIGTVEVTTFTINDVDATPEVDGNQFSYTPDEALANGDYKVVVAVTDDDGNMAQTSVVFVVDIPEPPEPPKDTTPPVISSVAPTGLIKGTDNEALGGTRASAVVTDEQSAISAVEFHINGVKIPVSRLNIDAGIIEAPIDFVTHGPGLYTVRLKATSEGGTTEHVWTFTFAIDDVKPTITSITPSGTFRGGLPVISASASDESGIDKMTITVMDSKGKEVKGNTEDDGEDTAKGISRLDFNPDAPLDEGIYTIAVRATDMIGNSATAKGSFTIDFDTAAPIITVASPHQNARFKLKPGEKAPTVSIAYADAESGINVDSVTLVIEGAASKYSATPSGTKITLTPQQKSASQVMYPLSLDTAAKPETWAGEYVVRFEVADNANQEGNVSAKNKGAREANRTVHTFSFFLEAAEGPILAARPLNYPNPFKDKTRISFSLARQATVSIVIYDTTLRPVRVLVDNESMNAGNHTHDHESGGSNAIGWDGTSSSGEDLARGIYFCEIIVADGFEPEYAILKLALTR